MLRPRIVTACVTLLTLVSAAGTASAQSSSLFGQSGPTGGQSTLGSSSSMQNSSSSSSSRSSTSSAAGGNTAGGNTAASGFEIKTNAPIGSTNTQLSGETGFVGRSDNAGVFVGNNRASTQTGAAGGNTQRGGTTSRGTSQQGGNTRQLQNSSRGGNQGFGNTGFGNTGFGNGRQGNTAVKGTLRPQQRVAFDFPARQQPVVVQTINTRFQNLQKSPALRQVHASPTAGGVVVLRGKVPTEHARKLAADMARLEPGVTSVQNNLEVAP